MLTLIFRVVVMNNLNKFMVLLLIYFFFSEGALAEGRCPPGQYPVGGQGVLGCAPIPGYGNQGGQAAPVPSGRWLTTWGAIAESSSTDLVGISVGEASQEAAERVALGKCAAEGDPNCSISMTYHNQCVAIAIPSSGKGHAAYANGPDESEVLDRAIARCGDTGGGECIRYYSDCSRPVFIPY